MEAIGEGAGEGDGVGFGNEGDGIGRGSKGVLEAVGDKFCIGEGIDADEMDKFAWVGGEGGDEGEGGGDFADGGVAAEKRDKFFGEAKALAFDGEVGSACDEVEGSAEGAEGGFVYGWMATMAATPTARAVRLRRERVLCRKKSRPPWARKTRKVWSQFKS